MLTKFPTYFVFILMIWRAVRTVSLLFMQFLNLAFNSLHFTSVHIYIVSVFPTKCIPNYIIMQNMQSYASFLKFGARTVPSFWKLVASRPSVGPNLILRSPEVKQPCEANHLHLAAFRGLQYTEMCICLQSLIHLQAWWLNSKDLFHWLLRL